MTNDDLDKLTDDEFIQLILANPRSRTYLHQTGVLGAEYGYQFAIDGLREILEHYPSLSLADVVVAMEYAFPTTAEFVAYMTARAYRILKTQDPDEPKETV